MELANKLALQYNGRLKDLLAELNDNLPGATFVHANVYDLVMELITNYDKYGNCYIPSFFFWYNRLQPGLEHESSQLWR